MRRAVLAALLLLLAPAALATDDRWPTSSAPPNPFLLAGSALTEKSLEVVSTAILPASMERVGGWTVYHLSTAAGGCPAGSATGNGSCSDPFDASFLPTHCGRAGVMCLLDSGETFVWPASIPLATTPCGVDELCTVITTSGDAPAILTTLGTAATDGPIFSNATVTTGGWALVSNLIIVSDEGDTDAAAEDDQMDVFWNNSSAGGVGRTVSINNHIALTGDGSDNCWTSHRDGKLIILGGSCDLTAASTGINPPLGFVNGSDVLAIGVDASSHETTQHDLVTLDTSGVTSIVDPASLILIDSLLDRGAVAGSGDAVVELNPGQTETVIARFAKVAMTASAAGSECIRTVVSVAGEGLTLQMNQVTMTGCVVGGLSSINTTLDGAAVLNVTMGGVTCDAMGGPCINFADASWATALTLDMRDWLFDASDSATELFVTAGSASTPSDTAADFQTELTSLSATANVNASTAIDSNDDARVQWSDGTTAKLGLDCDPANDCWQAYDSPYTVTFTFTTPAWLFGVPVTRATLGGTNRNIGR